MDHLDYLRIRNLEDSDSEVFQGVGGSSESSTPAADTTRIADALEKGLLTEDTEGVLEKALLQTDDNGELQSVFATTPLSPELKTWMGQMEAFISGTALPDWIDACWATDAANVAAAAAAQAQDLPAPLSTPMPPIPLPPTLPPLPLDPKSLIWQILMYYLKRYLWRLLLALLKKLMAKLPGWIDRPPSLDGLVQAVKDLQFNDLEFALPGGGRIHITGEWIKR
jgi:hypothetical protein